MTAGFREMASASVGSASWLHFLYLSGQVVNIRIASQSTQIIESTPGFWRASQYSPSHVYMPSAGWDNWETTWEWRNQGHLEVITCLCVRKGRLCWTVQKALMNEDQIMFQVTWQESRQENLRHSQPSGEHHKGIFSVKNLSQIALNIRVHLCLSVYNFPSLQVPMFR